MTTINISLPVKLQASATKLVRAGYYASFSDLVRTALRSLLERNTYDMWVEEAKHDVKTGKAVILRDKKDIDAYFKAV